MTPCLEPFSCPMMLTYPDIHTHLDRADAGFRIVSCPPERFAPREGCHYSVGFHPWAVSPEYPSEADWERLSALIRLPQVLALGEAGLDKLSAAPLPLQETLFGRQARLADEVGKPMVIHLVKAVDELLRLRRRFVPRVPWVIHGFRGKAPLAQELLRHGFYLSFGERFQEAALAAVPLSRLFIETDESPLPVAHIYARAARARQMPVEELAEAVRANVQSVFLP